MARTSEDPKFRTSESKDRRKKKEEKAKNEKREPGGRFFQPRLNDLVR